MNRFLKKLFLFLSPFVLYAAAVMIIDPYNFFNISHLISDAQKRPIAHLHYPLWKMTEFRRQPIGSVLLGDSRMGAISTTAIEKVANEGYYNFSYGGGTMEEVINTFWYADSLTKLKNVYIGINFNLYNAFARGDRTEDYRNITENPFRYFVHLSVLKAMWFNFIAALGWKVEIGVPQMTRDQFWKRQLQISAAGMYRKYEYPQRYHDELKRIVDHCRDNKIKLVFVMFPTHLDLQNRVVDFGLEGERERFGRDLAELAPTYDYDFPNEITKDRENFEDPFHFHERIMEMLVQDLWGSRHVLPVKILQNNALGSSNDITSPNVVDHNDPR
jgi:hypothetical protein